MTPQSSYLCVTLVLLFLTHRIAISIGFAVLVYFSQSFKEDDGFFPAWFTIALFGVLAFELIVHLSFEQSRSAFVASICDEKIGGTYIALLNTVADLGKTVLFYCCSCLTIMKLCYQVCSLSF